MVSNSPGARIGIGVGLVAKAILSFNYELMSASVVLVRLTQPRRE
jgi:hypothetical protein